jgi:hypothetical protein
MIGSFCLPTTYIDRNLGMVSSLAGSVLCKQKKMGLSPQEYCAHMKRLQKGQDFARIGPSNRQPETAAIEAS